MRQFRRSQISGTPASQTVPDAPGFELADNVGQARTKTSPTADPNSFLAYIVYQKVLVAGWAGPFQAPIFNYRFFGADFDRTAKDLDLITSPVLTLPIRLGTPPRSSSTPSSHPSTLPRA